jgi:hypothetical protein
MKIEGRFKPGLTAKEARTVKAMCSDLSARSLLRRAQSAKSERLLVILLRHKNYDIGYAALERIEAIDKTPIVEW